MYDYRYEPSRMIFMIDNKSFYASCECIRLGLNPMTTALAVLSHQPGSKEESSLIMAASPLAKKKYGLNNVMRARQLPPKSRRPDLILVEPHMNLYIKKSMEVLKIFEKYAAREDIHVYSIDESMIDMTESWKLFGNDPYMVGRRIQKDIKNEIGLYTTCGIGENPLLAKLAMDIDAKKRWSMISFWHYIDVPDTIWQIKDLEQVWGINRRIADRLRKLGIHDMNELAHSDPELLKAEFGIMGEQLFAMSWGVDRSIIRQPYHPKNKSYGNSQVLMKDYTKRSEIVVVIREIAEQVAARIRFRNLQTQLVHLQIGFSYFERGKRKGFNVSEKVSATNDNSELTKEVIALFDCYWEGESVRTIGVSYSNLISADVQQLSMFMSPERQAKKRNFDYTIDKIRAKYGFVSLVKASSLLPGATAIQRSRLVGGHNGGNSYE
ncbi:Y-family DNA polymerase [Lactobacillus psittaci]|uniref:Nucleotidyltransferase DNA polymerase for DNA repair n=1 Tax=Lactobacillus psittaci DSM 15354 TaxID=1122152 RepID=A0A0R1S2H2_9LACO|nr:Y-family DNA polymerase [Lactobacillus psittaci]KRL63280.1 nucleotidyltransferase DNA polymerase for DNA repair [Lactobacillus psittaci DSM 15354]